MYYYLVRKGRLIIYRFDLKNKTMNKRFILLSSLLALVFLAPAVIFAQGFDNLIDLADDFHTLLNTVTTVIIALALVFFLWGLATFILSAGDEEKRGNGKKIMIWGAIAFTVMLGIWGIVNFLLEAFGIGDISEPPIIPGV